MTFEHVLPLIIVPVLIAGAWAHGLIAGMWVSGEDVRILRSGKK